MRLWSLHPGYLDRAGLLAVWREGLLAQQVLRGATRGYRNHPQLQRFREQAEPLAAIGAFLLGIRDEGVRRGYRFSPEKIVVPGPAQPIPVTAGQLAYEWQHLLAKLQQRAPERWQELQGAAPTPHPSFTVVPGPVADWEIVSARG